jgi:hypothetical protein
VRLGRPGLSIGAAAGRRALRFSAPSRGDSARCAFEAELKEGPSELAAASATVEVKTSRLLDVALVEGADPVAPGEALTYTIAFGHRATASFASGTQLALELPAGATFVSASDGGLHAVGGDLVARDAEPGPGWRRSATVTAGAGRRRPLLAAHVEITDSTGVTRRGRSGVATRVRTGSSLVLETVAAPEPVRPGETLALELMAANRGALPVFDAVVELVVPEGVDDFDESFVTGPSPLCEVAINNGVRDAASGCAGRS